MDLGNLAVIVLAAGKGKRFGESYTKLLHPIFGKPLIYYPIQNLKNLGVEDIVAVVSDPKVKEEIQKHIQCQFVYQENLTGTANAVKLALTKFSFTPERWEAKTLMVLNGDDATLYTKKTLEEFLKSHELNHAQISMMTIKTSRNMEVGRVIRDKKRNFSKILEYKEYLESGARSNEINCGVYLFNAAFLRENLPKVEKSQNGEYYLTDLLNIAKEQEERINLYVLKKHSEWIGVNNKKDLKYARNVIKKRNLVMEVKGAGKSIHFLGIAGSGTSACAKLAEAAGFIVTGCDKSLSGEFTSFLGNVKTVQGHSPDHLDGVDILAVTPAILSLEPNNPEILEAKKRKIKVMTWQQFLGKFLTKERFVIAVCGTHGKSTTTAMAGKLLEDAGLDPTVLLGATAPFWNTNFRIGGHLPAGRQEYFVIEADEFNDNYMSLDPWIIIVTNIEYDHPEYFRNFDDYQSSFKNFLHKAKQLILANLDDKNTEETLKESKILDEPFFPPVLDFSKNLIDFPLKAFGRHNILNASAAFNLGLNLGIDPEVIKKSLQNFEGVGRRMEYLGKINGAKVYSDFAHHPTEIKVTIESLRQKHHGRDIIVLFQPHMFSRTKALFSDFVKVFKNLPVKKTYIIDIYPSREVDTGLVNSRQLVQAIGKENVEYSNDLNKTFNELTDKLSTNNLVIFMGAGDIDQKARNIVL